jgi:hypothetical protein
MDLEIVVDSEQWAVSSGNLFLITIPWDELEFDL